MLFYPKMQPHKRGKNLFQPLPVAISQIQIPFGKRQPVRTYAHGIKTMKPIVSVIPSQFPANKSVQMLLGVKVIQRAAEIKHIFRIFGKFHHGGRIAHKTAHIETGFYIASDKTVFFRRPADMPECKFPGKIVRFHLLIVPFPIRRRQPIFYFFIGRFCLNRSFIQKTILHVIRTFQIEVIVSVVFGKINFLIRTIALYVFPFHLVNAILVVYFRQFSLWTQQPDAITARPQFYCFILFCKKDFFRSLLPKPIAGS